MLDRGYLFFLFLSELSQEELLEKQSWCEQYQLNYHKQQGDGGGEAPQARPVITALELSSANRQHTSGLAEMGGLRLTGGPRATLGNCWHPQVLGMLLLMTVTIATTIN